MSTSEEEKLGWASMKLEETEFLFIHVPDELCKKQFKKRPFAQGGTVRVVKGKITANLR